MEKNKIIQNIEKCKCCLGEDELKDLWTEYYTDGERKIYGEMLSECFALNWEQPSINSDSDLEHICSICVSKLHGAVKFKREILLSAQLLLEEIKNDSYEVKMEDDLDTDIGTEYLSIEFLDDEGIVKEKSDIIMESPTKPIQELFMNRKSKSKNYTEEDFKKCLEAVKSKTLSRYKASLLYNVPRWTIRSALDRSKRRQPDDTSTSASDEEIFQGILHGRKGNLQEHGNNISNVLIFTNATPIRHHNDSGFSCSFCPQMYKNPANLKLHSLGHDISDKRNFIKGKRLSNYMVNLDITALYCKICKMSIKNLEDMLQHLKDHGKKINLNINNHIIPYKFVSEAPDLKCVTCNTVFTKFESLQQHMNVHSRNYVCNVCNSGFINHAYFSLHYREHSKDIFTCKFCPKNFNTKIKKITHEETVHAHLLNKFKCRHCGEKFPSYMKKLTHVSRKHATLVNRIKCQTCGKRCFTENSLRTHMRRDHWSLAKT